MGDPSVFSRALKRRRQERGLTQDDLAERVGCATQTIRKLEGGQRRPSFQMAERLAQVLQLAPDEHAAWMCAARESYEQEPTSQPPDEPQIRAQPRSLPTYLTPFVGREREQADLARLLQTPGCRLVTVLGPGGSGKTRLAVEVARQIDGFPDGAAFVSLASVAGAPAVVSALGDGLGFTFSGPTNLTAQVIGFLHDKRALLLLDNLEHLLDQSGSTLTLLDQLLAQAPHITLLVTSRERLKLPGEWVLEIEGLGVPPVDAPRCSADYPALALFLEHARRAQHNFRLVPENERAVATICRLVGGLPLGIELAAAWVRMLSPDEIGQELVRNLDAHHLSPGTLPARHHSLRSVVEHSWRLLSESERRALGGLAVFQGGFSREAAEIVADADLSVLTSLADKSLLRRGAASRYDLHEIIRQYAAARLRENEEELATTHDRHAAYYMAWLAQREHPIQTTRQAAVLKEITGEIDNIRAAWQWALTHRRLDDLQRGAETLQWFYEFRSWFQEAAAVFGQAVEALRYTPPTKVDDKHQRVLGQILGHYAYLAARVGAFEQAQEAVTDSINLLRGGDDTIALAHALMYQGMVSMQIGDYYLARVAFTECMALANSDDLWTNAFCQTWGSMLAHACGEYREAERLFRAGLANYRAMGNPRCTVFCLTFCSITLVALRKYDEAQILLREGLMLAGLADDRWGMAMVLQHLGLVALAQQDVQEAGYLFRESLVLLRATGNRWEIARVLNHLGATLFAMGAPEAGKTYREALETAVEVLAIPDALQALAGIAAQFEQQGRYAEALGFTARILSDPAIRSETREQVVRLRDALRPHLSVQQINVLEERAQHWSLTEIVTKIVDPSPPVITSEPQHIDRWVVRIPVVEGANRW